MLAMLVPVVMALQRLFLVRLLAGRLRQREGEAEEQMKRVIRFSVLTPINKVCLPKLMIALKPGRPI